MRKTERTDETFDFKGKAVVYLFTDSGKGVCLMKNSTLYYSVGALLYCPANHPGIADSIIAEKFEGPFSLALCLEDTIPDNGVAQAEEALAASLKRLFEARRSLSFFMPRSASRRTLSRASMAAFMSELTVSNKSIC